MGAGLNFHALAKRLSEAEGELTRLQRQAEPPKRAAVTRLVPRIGQALRALYQGATQDNRSDLCAMQGNLAGSDPKVSTRNDLLTKALTGGEQL
jgi:hypothetical protein